MSSGFPIELFNCTNLKIIILDYQGIVSVPPEIEKLTKLTELRVSNNPNLLSVPAELGKIKTLKGKACSIRNEAPCSFIIVSRT